MMILEPGVRLRTPRIADEDDNRSAATVTDCFRGRQPAISGYHRRIKCSDKRGKCYLTVLDLLA